jgi:hypothetical protein
MMAFDMESHMPRAATDIDKLSITLDQNGTATVTGIGYDDLRSLLTAASLHRHDNGFKATALDGLLDEVTHANNLESYLWHLHIDLVLDVLTAKLGMAISPAHAPDVALIQSLYQHKLNDLEQTVREAEAQTAKAIDGPDEIDEASETITNALRDAHRGLARLASIRRSIR